MEGDSPRVPMVEDVTPFHMMKHIGGEDDGYIARSKSMDETIPLLKRPASMDQADDCAIPAAAVALHASFDSALLRETGDESTTACSGPLFGDEHEDKYNEADLSFGELSGRKHLRQRSTGNEHSIGTIPRTVRKQPRRNAKDQALMKTPSRHRARTPGTVKKTTTTPSSAVKRRRAPLPQRMSPMRRAYPPTPLQSASPTPLGNDGLQRKSELKSSALSSPLAHHTPSRAYGKTREPISNRHSTGTTAASTHLETTFESDSVDTFSPTSKSFRFTSFPASLPRVNNPRANQQQQCPDSVRKKMFAEGEAVNQSREDDAGTHNTSISSLSGGEAHIGASEIGLRSRRTTSAFHEEDATGSSQREGASCDSHTKLFAGDVDDDNDQELGYSDDESVDSPVRGFVERTRLNFNDIVMSPPGKKSTKGFQLDQDGKVKPFELNMELAKPYEQRRMNSFQSSISSNTAMNNLSGCEDSATLTPARSFRKDKPMTPTEVQLHFPLESECSPIPSKDDLPSNLSHPTFPTGGDNRDSPPLSTRRKTRSSPRFEKSSLTGAMENEEGSTVSSASVGRSRAFRPMPDMSAFENTTTSSRDGRSDDSATLGTLDSKGPPSSQRRLCPPTPVRTPAWANDTHAYFHRQNSLITTKVLLSVPSQVLAGRTSLESSVLDDHNNRCESSGKQSDAKSSSGVTGTASTAPVACLPSIIPSSVTNCNDATPSVHLKAPPRLLRQVPSTQNNDSVISFSNDFEIQIVLGRGAFADVYKAKCLRDNQMYAVKRNRRQFRGKRDRDMAMTEVKSMQRLQSVCAETGQESPSADKSYCLYLLFFYRAWQEDGYFYCQTELCCRSSCRDLLDSLLPANWSTAKIRYPSLANLEEPQTLHHQEDAILTRKIPLQTIWKVCHDVAAGLSHIHRTGLVHQDLKPSNIFFVAHPRFGAMCKIGDFGSAGEVGATADGLEGDARYMPPELLVSSKRKESVDVFCLGLTLFEMASDQCISLPSEGPYWHELRSAGGPNLDSLGDVELQNLIRTMITPFEGQRPSADRILEASRVTEAGNIRDEFLRDYVHDVDEFDRKEFERMAEGLQEDQTPRNDRSTTVHSPSLSMLLPCAPSLRSPLAPPLQNS